MHTFAWILGVLLAAFWVHRLVDAAIGVPTIADVAGPDWDLPADGRSVTVVVPARNEHEHIEATLRSLLALE